MSDSPCGNAGLAVLAWLPIFSGEMEFSTAFSPVDWHVHEMLYGYVPAVVTGFLLTAIPNWTGQLPIQGTPLLVLVLVWIVGRVFVTLSAETGWLLAAIVDVSFLALVVAATAREIVAGKNWRNLRVVGLVTVLLAGNIAFHIEAHVRGTAEYGARTGIAAIVLLIVVIGGRIVPSFTRNWLARENPGRLPAPLGRFDVAVIGITAATLALYGVLQAVDGVALKQAVNAWASAPDAEKATRFASAEYRTLGPLGRRPDFPRPLGSYSAYWIRLRADRLLARKCSGARYHYHERWDPCLDGRSGGYHDPRGDDACQPGSYRQRACGFAGDAGDLCSRDNRRVGTDMCLFGAGIE